VQLANATVREAKEICRYNLLEVGCQLQTENIIDKITPLRLKNAVNYSRWQRRNTCTPEKQFDPPRTNGDFYNCA
jgi:hypothetical protein